MNGATYILPIHIHQCNSHDFLLFSCVSIKKNMKGSFPKKLSKILNKDLMILVRFKPTTDAFRQSSMPVVQFTSDLEALQSFTYTGLSYSKKVVSNGKYFNVYS